MARHGFGRAIRDAQGVDPDLGIDLVRATSVGRDLPRVDRDALRPGHAVARPALEIGFEDRFGEVDLSELRVGPGAMDVEQASGIQRVLPGRPLAFLLVRLVERDRT